MEPTAPSLTEEDLTEVKKDVSSTTLPRRPAGWGRVGAGCRPAGEESGNPESEEEPVGRRSGQDRREPCSRGSLVEGIPQRRVSPGFKSLEAGLGFPKPPSVECYFTVCFLPTRRLSPGDFTPVRFGAALLDVRRPRFIFESDSPGCGPNLEAGPGKGSQAVEQICETLVQSG